MKAPKVGHVDTSGDWAYDVEGMSFRRCLLVILLIGCEKETQRATIPIPNPVSEDASTSRDVSLIDTGTGSLDAMSRDVPAPPPPQGSGGLGGAVRRFAAAVQPSPAPPRLHSPNPVEPGVPCRREGR